MSEPMTVDEARRLIELCREVDAKATPRGMESRMYWTGGWERSDAPQVEAIMLWRAGFGALLVLAEEQMDRAADSDDPRAWFDYVRSIAPLAEWADQTHPGWRTR